MLMPCRHALLIADQLQFELSCRMGSSLKRLEHARLCMLYKTVIRERE